MGEPEPPEDQGSRSIENAVMLGFFVVLVGGGSLAARHHGRCAQGPGLCGTGSPQLQYHRNSGSSALD
jgi:hypothetical protein